MTNWSEGYAILTPIAVIQMCLLRVSPKHAKHGKSDKIPVSKRGARVNYYYRYTHLTFSALFCILALEKSYRHDLSIVYSFTCRLDINREAIFRNKIY